MEGPTIPVGAILLWDGDDIPPGFAEVKTDGCFIGGKSLPEDSNPVVQSFQTQPVQHASMKTIVKLDEDPAAKEKRLREHNTSMLNLEPNEKDKY